MDAERFVFKNLSTDTLLCTRLQPKQKQTQMPVLERDHFIGNITGVRETETLVC
jgi:hypothetical protein